MVLLSPRRLPKEADAEDQDADQERETCEHDPSDEKIACYMDLLAEIWLVIIGILDIASWERAIKKIIRCVR